MTVTEFRREQQRIDDTFSVLASISERLPNMSAEETHAVLSRIHGFRHEAGADVPAAAQATATPVQAVSPAPRPTPTPSGDASLDSWRPGKFMFQAINRVATAAREIEQKTNFGFDKSHACLLGAFVTKGKHETMTQTFTGGKTYVLVGGGEDNATDVDIAILDSSGKVLASDTQDGAMPLVKFVPPSDASYEIRLGLAKSTANGSFIAMAVMHEGGYAIPSARLTDAFQKVTAYGARASQKLSPGLVFHQQGNWSFFGTVLEQGQQSSFQGIDVAGKPSIVLAAGDSAASNLDLVALNPKGETVTSDTDADSNPVIQLSPHSGYTVAVQNKSSSGASFAALMLLDRQD